MPTVIDRFDRHRTSAASYYQIRCPNGPGRRPTDVVVEAQSWEEVLLRHPAAELVTVNEPTGNTSQAVPREQHGSPSPRQKAQADTRRPQPRPRAQRYQPRRRHRRGRRPLEESVTALALVGVAGLLVWVLGTIRP